MRSLFLMIMLVVCGSHTLFAQTNQVNVNGVTVTVSSKQLNPTAPSKYNLNTCEESFVLFNFNNTTGAAIDNFVISTQANVNVLLLYSNLTDPNLMADAVNGMITIVSLPSGQSSLQVPIKASCENFKSATHSSTATLTFSYNNSSVTQTQNIDFVITSGVIGYVASDDLMPNEHISYTGHKGDTFKRRFNFQVTDHEFSGVLHMDETIPSTPTAQLEILSLELKINGVSQWIEMNNLVDPITNKLIRDIALDHVPLNATIEIFEEVKIIGCPTGTGKLIFTYGCENSNCIPLREMDLATNLGIEKPNLEVTDRNPFDFGTCLASSDNIVRRKFRIENTGNAKANNVYTSLRGGTAGIFPLNIVPLHTITVTGNIPQGNITFDPESSGKLSDKRGFTTNALSTDACFQDDLVIHEQGSIRVLVLEPGQYIDIEWEERTCCVSNDKTNNYKLNAYGLMDTKCDNECGGFYAGTYWVGSGDEAIVTGASQIELTGLNNMFGCFTCTGGCGSNPAGTCDDLTLNNPSASSDYTETLKLKNNGFKLSEAYDEFLPVDYGKFRLVVDFAVDGKLLLAPESSGFRGNLVLKDGAGTSYHPVSQTVLNTTEIFDLFGATDIPATAVDAGARAVFEFDPDIIFGVGTTNNLTTHKNPRLKSILQSFINSLETSFEVSGVCDRPVASTGPSNYYERMYLVPDGDDCPECKLAIGSYSDYIIVNCPGCMFPGVLVKGYEVERITLGEVDSDNNGLRDANGVVATGSPNLKMVTDNDIFKAKTTTTLWEGTARTYGSGSTYGSLEQEPGFSNRFLTNFARLDLIGPYGNFMDVLVSIDHPIVVDYKQGNNSYHFIFTSNADNVWSSNGAGHFLFQFPIALIRQKLQSTYGFSVSQASQFNYEANDQAEITAYYKVKPDFDLGSKYYESIDVSTRCFYSDRIKDISITTESDPVSPYGISGSLKADEVSQLKPYLNYICEAYGSGFILADIKESFQFRAWGAGNNHACYKDLMAIKNTSAISETEQQLDLFPYEIRTFSRTENMRFVLATGYKLNKEASYIQSNKSFRIDGEYDYKTYAEIKTFNDLSSSQIVSKGPSIEIDNNGNSHVVGEIFEIVPDYNPSLTYKTQSYEAPYYFHAGDKFNDCNEFDREYYYFGFTPDCSVPILDYFEYTDNPVYRINNGWVDFNKYFVVEGPKAVMKSYDADKHIFSTSLITNIDTEGRSWYNRPSAALWGGPAQTIVSITKVVANVDIFTKVSKVPFKLTAIDQSANVFMYFTTKYGKVILGDLIKTNADNSTQVFQKVQGVYQLGNLTAGQVFDFNLNVEFQCNDIKDDELYLHVGYTCDNTYPTFINGQLDKVPCGIMNESIRIIESLADMSVSYSNTATCSNVSHELKMTSLLDGGLYDFKPTLQLPSTLTYKLGSAKLKVYEIVNNVPVSMKDASGADILFTLSDPLVSSPNILSWDLTDLAGLDDLYIHGGGYALLTFDSDPACGTTSGVVNASAIATTYCNTAISKALLNPANVVFATSCAPVVTIVGTELVCPNASNVLYTQLSGAPLSNVMYTWYKVTNGTRELLRGPDNISTYTYYGLAETTTFEVVISSDQSTCTASDDITVSLYNLTNITIIAPNEFCLGSAPVAVKGLPEGGYFAGPGISYTPTGGYTFYVTVAGTYEITYFYNDPLTGCFSSKIHTIIVSACCKYALASTEVMCGEDAIRCITLKAVKPVDDGIKGMDFILRYDRTLMRPTGLPGRGNATLGNVVLNGGMNSGMGSYAMTERAIAGTSFNELSVSIFYTGQAPAAADFDGIGDVICIEFKILGTATTGLAGTTKSIFIGDFFQGAFSPGVVDDEHKLFMIRSCVENNGTGVISILKNNFLNGKVYYHNDINAPLRYDAATTPSPYLITTIAPVTTGYGSSLCTPSAVAAKTTDINGAYSIDLTGANGVKVSRDIVGDYYNSCTNPSDVIDQTGNVYNPGSLLMAINGYDAYLMQSITTMRSPSDVVYVADRKVPGVNSANTANASFPTPFQMIASDVNMDKMVRAVDITLVQERAVSKLCEYPQVWNYNLGLDPAVYPSNTADQRSLDWRFIDKSQVITNLSYKKSDRYPLPPGGTGTGAAGYWRDNVPNPPRCLMGPAANLNVCKSYASSFDIHAIMLGDIDGSWRANYNNSQQNLRTVSDRQVVINTTNKQRIGVNTYRVPVRFVSQDPATVSLDFALDYNEEQLSIQGVGNLEGGNLSGADVVYNDFENKQLLFTSYTMTGFNAAQSIYYIDFVSKDGSFHSNMLGSGDAYLNGEKVQLVVEGSTITGIEDQLSGTHYGFELLPNPAANEGEILYNIKAGTQAKIVVYNTLGQVVTEYKELEGQGSIQVGTSDWSSGMYQVILFTENSQKLVKKWVIQN